MTGAQPATERTSKARLEAFSDGVLAVVITLLVLDLHTDAASPKSLADQLVDEWPSFAAYVVSFFVVGVIWVNHHALFAIAARVDRMLMFANLVLLLFVSTIPFTTATLADYLRQGDGDARLAVVLYGVTMEGMAISFTVILRHLLSHGLTTRPVTPERARNAIRRFGLGTVVYPAVAVVGLFSPVAMLVLYAALTAFYIVEQTPILED